MAVNNTIIWHNTTITKGYRKKLNGFKSCVLWITGLSAAGKSTLANALECKLYEIGVRTYLLDGDNIRTGLNRDLGFSESDRRENIRRIAEVSKLFVDAGIMVIVAIISPYLNDRSMARQIFEAGEFVEIYLKCPLFECEKRDPKGLYKKAREGKILNFTGVSAPYEEPEKPELLIETNKCKVEDGVHLIINYLIKHQIL